MLCCWFMLCCCKMPVFLYWLSRSAFFEVLSIKHDINVTWTQCPMSCSYHLRTGGRFQFSYPNACQDSWGCGKSKSRFFYLYTIVSFITIRGARDKEGLAQLARLAQQTRLARVRVYIFRGHNILSLCKYWHWCTDLFRFTRGDLQPDCSTDRPVTRHYWSSGL